MATSTRTFVTPFDVLDPEATRPHNHSRTSIDPAHLWQACTRVTAETEHESLLRVLAEEARHFARADAVSVMLPDPRAQEFHIAHSFGLPEDTVREARAPFDDGIAGWVYERKQGIVLQNPVPDLHHTPPNTRKRRIASAISVPLYAEAVAMENPIGVLNVSRRRERYSNSDLPLLQKFAAQAAVALKNLLHYDEMQIRTRWLSNLIDVSHNLTGELELDVLLQRVVENARLYRDLEDSFTDIIRVILNAVEARDGYTRGHIGRVTHLAREVARELGLSEDKMQLMGWGSLLHDIGKIGVSDVVLNKPAQLTHDEFEHMKKHPVVGAKMIKGVKFLQPIVPTILYHQEKWDGTGYPRGLRGDEIPIEARIISVVDTFDALRSDRPYRRGTSAKHALAEIARYSGTQFDPKIVTALERLWQRGTLARGQASPQDDE